jgi:hypothetical protein
MDCAEFQRRLGADPNALDAGMRAHASGCADCTRALAQAQAFERRLADAFAVPVPADLAARVLAASRIDAEPRREPMQNRCVMRQRKPTCDRCAPRVRAAARARGSRSPPLPCSSSRSASRIGARMPIRCPRSRSRTSSHLTNATRSI